MQKFNCIILFFIGFIPFSAQADEVLLAPVSAVSKGYAADILETPSAVTVLERENLFEKGGQNLGDVLRGEPGVSIANDSAQGQNPVIRGLGKDSIVLLADGMRLNAGQPAGALASFISLGLADRVEVLKGASSVLYGTGALGGAVNVIMPQAQFTPGIRAETSTSYDSASQGVNGALVLNASGNDHALMLGGAGVRMQDYQSPKGKVDRTGYNAHSFIGQYRFRLDAQQQLRLSAQVYEDSDVWYPGSSKKSPSPLVGSTTIHSPEQARRLFEVGYSAKSSENMPLNLDVRLYRQEVEREMYSWANRLQKDISTTHASFITDGLDAKAGWLLTSKQLLSVGINFWQMQADPERYMAMPPGFTNQVPNSPFKNGKSDALGFYIQDDMQLGALNILAGLRYDVVRTSAQSMNNGMVSDGLRKSDQALSGNVGLVYEITPLLRPYASYSKAFRAPGMRERYESGLRGDGYYYAGSPEVQAEKSDQFEIGLKGGNAHLNYGISAFYNIIDNYITGQVLTGSAALHACGPANATNCKKNVNLGEASMHGLEAQAQWQFTPGHWFKTRYSLIRGKNKDLDEPLFQMPADEISLGWLGHIKAGVTGDFTLRLVDRQKRVARQFTQGTEDATPGFASADIGLTWQLNKTQKLRFLLKNIADKAYHEHLTEGISGQEILAPGRSAQISWRGNF